MIILKLLSLHLVQTLFLFYISGLEKVIAAIDGCHIGIRGPKLFKRDYINRKGWESVVVQGSCDHQFLFTRLVLPYMGAYSILAKTNFGEFGELF